MRDDRRAGVEDLIAWFRPPCVPRMADRMKPDRLGAAENPEALTKGPPILFGREAYGFQEQGRASTEPGGVWLPLGVAEIVQLSSMKAKERDALAARAASLIDQGALVLLPTETVYGVAASASRPDTLGKLAAFAPGVKRTISAKGVGPNGFTWHTADVAAVKRAAKVQAPTHQRIFSKLLPGPVRLLIEGEFDKPVAGEICGAFLAGRVLSVRIPGLAFAREVLSRAREPVAMDRVPSAISSTGKLLDGADLKQNLDAAGVALCIDDGATEYGGISSAVRLTRAGGYAVESEGALSAREIDDAVVTRVLFVCSGNTCRSPMAERIARDVLERSRSGPVRAESAGTSASEGEPSAREGDEALAEMGIRVEQARHRSRGLTREMVRSADHVFTMTRGHREAVLAVAPESADKVKVLDPAGDIPDPIGSGLQAYRKTAERIRAGILQRFAEAKLVPGETGKKQRVRAAGEKT